ncbi:MAG: S-type pyocin domain-containing protein [Pseudomonas sp.]|nr:S-type pyocin domain-containing protein [Pseudomonas sp.]
MALTPQIELPPTLITPTPLPDINVPSLGGGFDPFAGLPSLNITDIEFQEHIKEIERLYNEEQQKNKALETTTKEPEPAPEPLANKIGRLQNEISDLETKKANDEASWAADPAYAYDEVGDTERLIQERELDRQKYILLINNTKLLLDAALQEAARIAAEQAQAEAARIAAEQAQAEAARIAAEQAQAEAARIAAEQAQAEAARIAAEQVLKQTTSITFNASGTSARSSLHISQISGRETTVARAAATALHVAIRTAAAGALVAAGAALFTPTVIVASVVGGIVFAWPARLKESERSFSLSVPLSEISAIDANALAQLAESKGRLDLPVSLTLETEANESTLSLALSDDFTIARQVKVLPAHFDNTHKVYALDLEDSLVRFTWTPADAPGTDVPISTPLPQHPANTTKYIGATLTPIKSEFIPLPATQDDDIERMIVWFPADSGLSPLYVLFKKRTGPRFEPGTASGLGENFEKANWLGANARTSGAAIPKSVAIKLEGRRFVSFDSFRKAFWYAVASDIELLSQFAVNNQKLIASGNAPIVEFEEMDRGRSTYELHHVHEIKDGGAVYDVDNLKVMTPKAHNIQHKKVTKPW